MTSSVPTAAGSSALTGPVREAARRLNEAIRSHTTCPPIRDLFAREGEDLDTESQMRFGYAVQRLLTDSSVATGRRIVGAKIGLTAPVVQQQLGVDRPDSGVLFADMARTEDEIIDPAQLLQPRIEAEVAFTLGADLDRDDLSDEVVRGAVETVVASLEIVDSRIAGWDIRLVDTIADNASCGLYVLGRNPVPLTGLNLPDAAMTMRAVGQTEETVSEGSGSACLGDPVNALRWLARTAREVGAPLRAGDVVLSGALGPMVPVRPDTTYVATIDGLGTVRATFGAAS
ncbi:MAG TPA: fumarylacetoacetate hydrolase family protein [Pseudonocardia sp.]|jgi:2-keto-4-pentenoate hydratase|nr:fumarylacetoacetate hydrolase family protein [Pseudonocardia sp.]